MNIDEFDGMFIHGLREVIDSVSTSKTRKKLSVKLFRLIEHFQD